ncbi:MAG: hypothetical protein WA001_02670 [Patescibacteria group bacterium]
MAYTKEFLDQMATVQEAFVWEAPAWETYERGSKWHIWMLLGAGALIIYAILTTNYLFAFIILLTAIILILVGNPYPHMVLVQIGQNGIVYDGRLYQFSQLNDFAIIYHPPNTKILYLEPKNPSRPRLRILLEDEDPVAIRLHLKNYLDEDLDLRDEHLSDIFGRLLGI